MFVEYALMAIRGKRLWQKKIHKIEYTYLSMLQKLAEQAAYGF